MGVNESNFIGVVGADTAFHDTSVKKIHYRNLTCATEVVMIVPPAAPITINTLPFLSRMIAGTVEDCGLLPGLM